MKPSANSRKDGLRMLVRRYVMDLIYQQHMGQSVRVPSYNVLSEKLGMARSTAQMELKCLVDEGFLIAKVGIGTFTNPAINFGLPKGMDNPLVGIIDGDGRVVHERYYGLALKGHLAMELAKLPATVLEIARYAEKDEAFFEELRSVQCNYIVWFRPPKELHGVVRKLAAARPVLTVEDGLVPGVPGLDFDRHRKGIPVAEWLLREGRTRLLFFQNQRYRESTFRAFQEVYAKAGIKISEKHFFLIPKDLDALKACLDSGYRPQAVMFAHEAAEMLMELLGDHGIDLQEECRLVSPMFKPRSLKAPMLLPEFPFAAYARSVADEVARRLSTPGLPPEHKIVYHDFPIGLV